MNTSVTCVIHMLLNKLGMPCCLDENHFGLSFENVFGEADYSETKHASKTIIGDFMSLSTGERREAVSDLSPNPCAVLHEHTRMFLSDIEKKSNRSLKGSQTRNAYRQRRSKRRPARREIGKLMRYTNNAIHIAHAFLCGGLNVNTCACFWHGRNNAVGDQNISNLHPDPVMRRTAPQFASRKLKRYTRVRTPRERLTISSHKVCEGGIMRAPIIHAILVLIQSTSESDQLPGSQAKRGLLFSHIIEYMIPQVVVGLTFESYLWHRWLDGKSLSTLRQLRGYHAQSMCILCIILRCCTAMISKSPKSCHISHICNAALRGLHTHEQLLEFIQSQLADSHINSVRSL